MKFVLNLGKMAVSLYILRRNNLLEIRIILKGSKVHPAFVAPEVCACHVD
jgi:hypothetical protein